MKQIIIKKFYEVISIINKKKTLFKGFLQGSPLGPLLTNRISIGRKNTKRTQRDGRNNKYVLIPEVNILGRKNTKQTQRRGRNVWAWVS
jgi:hypothetical protein